MQRNAGLALISKLLLILTVLIAGSVLYGWVFHDLAFVKLGPRLPPMVFNTALFFILYSFNLIFDRKKFFTPLTVLNAVLLVFSFLTILEYSIPADFGIDELFFKDSFRLDLTHPGRMGPNTAFGFIVFSLAFFFRPIQYAKFRLRNMFPMVLFTFAILIGVMSLFGFVFSAERGYVWGSFTRLALQTGVCFLFLGVAGLIENIRSLEYLSQIEKKTKKLIVAVISSVIGATITLWFIFCSLDAHKIREIVKSENSHIQGSMTQSLKNRLDSLERVGKRLEAGHTTYQSWKIEADQLVKHFDGLESLSLLDKNHKILYYVEELSTRLNIESLLKSPVLVPALSKSQINKTSLYSEAFTNDRGKGGFFAVVPLYKNNQYDGALVGYYSGGNFFKGLLSPFDHLIKINSGETLLYTNITPKTPLIAEWGYEGRVDYGGVKFTTTIIPAKKIIATHLGVTPTIVLIIGVFLSILMAAFIASIYELRVARNRHAYIAQWQRAILNGTDLGIVSTDTYGNIILINPAAEKLLGQKEKDVVGKISPASWHDPQEVQRRAQELSHELGLEIRPGIETFFAKSVAGLPDKEKWTVYRKNGEARKISLSVHALRSNEGEIDGFLGVMEDITDKEKQQLLIEDQRMKMVASSKMSSLGEMAAGIAHEINNPLTVIKGMAKMIQLSTEAESTQKSAETIENTVNRIAKIIGSLKTFARDSGQEEITLVKVSSILDETIPFCAERFRNLNIDLRISPVDELELRCRPIQISQVLLNLLNNAHDAINHLDSKWVEINVQKKDEFVEISVVDSGEGISEEIETKMMQPFFTTKEVGKGTGLGLSISAGIIESHNGKLYYDRYSKNTRFVVELPYTGQS